MATFSNILAWRIPWTEGLDGPQSTGSQCQTPLWACGQLGCSSKRQDLSPCQGGGRPPSPGRGRKENFSEKEKGATGQGEQTATEGGPAVAFGEGPPCASLWVRHGLAGFCPHSGVEAQCGKGGGSHGHWPLPAGEEHRVMRAGRIHELVPLWFSW